MVRRFLEGDVQLAIARTCDSLGFQIVTPNALNLTDNFRGNWNFDAIIPEASKFERLDVRLELLSGTLVPASQLQGVFADDDSSDKQPSAAALLLRKLGRHEWGGYFLAYDALAAFAVCRSEAFAAPRRRYLREVSASGVLGQWEETETETEGGGAVYELPAVDVEVYRSFLRGQSTY